MKRTRIILATVIIGAAGMAQAQTQSSSKEKSDSFEGYDFGQVVETLETSVSPLQREIQQSFRVFLEAMSEADELLEKGDTREAVHKAAAAIDGVLTVRQNVLEPMWQGQVTLTEQTAKVRQRLAAALAASGQAEPAKLDERTEAMLDLVAKRVAAEKDPLRHKRLVAHYRTLRNLSRIKQMAQQLSPNQRQLWANVLQVLEEAALAHQQVLMGTEVLFAQFEATASNLNEYMSLMDTVDGARRLLKMIHGAEEDQAGMADFANNMVQLQERLGGFHESVEDVLQSGMMDLEAQIESLAPMTSDVGGSGSSNAVVMSGEVDAELQGRLERLRNEEQPQR